MSKPITSREMRALEINAEYYGISALQLMENAGHAVAEEISSRFKPESSVAIFCGLGGNGGDGFAIARHLLSKGFRVSVFLAGRAHDISHEAASKNYRALMSLRQDNIVIEVHDSSLIPDVKADIAVDALLGTGSKGSLRPPIMQFVEEINKIDAFRVAVDVPTGVDADTGEVAGNAVKADMTVTFHLRKRGLERAAKHVGQLVVKEIGLPREIRGFIGPGDVLLTQRPRAPAAHKGDHGRLLIVGGSELYTGAPALAALAGLRTGVDLVYVASPAQAAHIISSMSPNLIAIRLKGDHLSPKNLPQLEPYLEIADAVILGPGLGLHRDSSEFANNLVDTVEHAGKPLLLDADGLKAYAGSRRPLKTPSVLTPHSGEYSLLTGRDLPENLEKRMDSVHRAAEELHTIILLKGSMDIISDGRRVKINFTGNPGMTAGGTGDVLSGIVGALLAQKADPFEAAVAGAFVNGAAGDFAFSKKGYHIVSTDLLQWIPHVFRDPMSHSKVQKTNAENGQDLCLSC